MVWRLRHERSGPCRRPPPRPSHRVRRRWNGGGGLLVRAVSTPDRPRRLRRTLHPLHHGPHRVERHDGVGLPAEGSVERRKPAAHRGMAVGQVEPFGMPGVAVGHRSPDESAAELAERGPERVELGVGGPRGEREDEQSQDGPGAGIGVFLQRALRANSRCSCRSVPRSSSHVRGCPLAHSRLRYQPGVRVSALDEDRASTSDRTHPTEPVQRPATATPCLPEYTSHPAEIMLQPRHAFVPRDARKSPQ